MKGKRQITDSWFSHWNENKSDEIHVFNVEMEFFSPSEMEKMLEVFFPFWKIHSPRGYCLGPYTELQAFESLCKLYRQSDALRLSTSFPSKPSAAFRGWC